MQHSKLFLSFGAMVCTTALVGCLYDDQNITAVNNIISMPSEANVTKDTTPHECSTKLLNNPFAHENCLRSISVRAKKLSEDFYTKAHEAVGLNPKTTNRSALTKAWQNFFRSPTDEQAEIIRNIGNFEKPCSEILGQTIRDPGAPLKFSHTTGYGAARYCLQSAIKISRQSGISFDAKAAADLLDAIDNLYAHYEAHPIGEGKPAYGTQNPF